MERKNRKIRLIAGDQYIGFEVHEGTSVGTTLSEGWNDTNTREWRK